MGKGETKRSVASHRDPGDGPRLALSLNPVFAFDVGYEFLQEEVAVADFAVGRVYVEAGLGLWRDNQEIDNFVLLSQVLDQVPSASFEQSLFILAESVEEIECGIAFRR